MPIMNLSVSDNPPVRLPSSAVIGEPTIRKAVEHYADTIATVRQGHDVSNRLQAGHAIDELSPQQIADAVTASRASDELRAGAAQRLHDALNGKLGAWVKDAQTQRAKAKETALQTIRAALDSIDNLEIVAGVVEMLDRHPGRIVWEVPRSVGVDIGNAQQSLRALVDRLEAEGQQ